MDSSNVRLPERVTLKLDNGVRGSATLFCDVVSTGIAPRARFVKGGKVVYEATKQRTWAGAERRKQTKLQAMEEESRGGPPPPPKASVEEAVNLYIADKEQQGVEAGTVNKNRLTVNRLHDFCDLQGISSVAAITSAHLIACRGTWEWYAAAESRRNEQTRLRSFFRWCVKNDFVTKNPAAALSAIKEDRVPTMPYEPEHRKAIISACSQCEFTEYRARRVRALVLLMRHSGLSIIDAASLAREELQLTNGEYAVVRRRLKPAFWLTTRSRTRSLPSCSSCRTPIRNTFSGRARELRSR
jgi:hypothetical protein